MMGCIGGILIFGGVGLIISTLFNLIVGHYAAAGYRFLVLIIVAGLMGLLFGGDDNRPHGPTNNYPD